MKRPAGLYPAYLFQFLIAVNILIDDTMLDMIFVLIGSVVVALVGNRYLVRYSKEEIAGTLVASGEAPLG